MKLTSDSTPRRALFVMASAVTLATAACAPEAPLTAVVQLGVTADSVTFVDRLATAPAEAAQPGHGLLRYQLTGPSGEVLAEGTTADPRRPAMYWTQKGPEPYLEAGSLFLSLPRAAGELVVGEPAQGSWKVIGRLAFDPNLRRAAGLLDFDIRSGAVHVSGSAPADRAINIVVLSEGYTASQLDQFHADVDRMVPRFHEHPDFADHARHFNVWRVDVASRQSGIDDPDGASRDTAFNTSFGEGTDEDPRRGVYTRGLGAHLKNALFKRKIGRLVGHPVAAYALMVHAPEYGGAAAGDLVTVSRESDDTGFVLAHELGHSLLKLGDEYEYGECMLDPKGFLDRVGDGIRKLFWGERELPVNVARSAERGALPWADLVPQSTPLPTPAGDPRLGAHEGAFYCDHGMYRPQHTCLMRDHGQRMCAVCRRELDRYVARLTGQPYEPVANRAPEVRITGPKDGQTVRLQSSDIVYVHASIEDAGGLARAELFVDGQSVAALPPVATSEWYRFPARIDPGVHRLRVVAWDTLGLEGADEITVTFVAEGATPPADKLAFGESCESGTECDSGACVPGISGRFCTKICDTVADCGAGYQCAGSLCLAARPAPEPTAPEPVAPDPAAPGGAPGGNGSTWEPPADAGGCALIARPAPGAGGPLLLLLLLAFARRLR